MLFSRTAVHGIYTLCFLNRESNTGPLPSSVVATALGIPREQAAKVLQGLNNAGLVESIRGRRGGYMLTRKLNAVSVTDVLDALNPPEDDARMRPESCKRDPTELCSAHRGLQRLNDRVRKALAGEMLTGLTGTVCTDVDLSSGNRRAELVSLSQGETCQ